jgi:DNA invertase Pin-like site-specific DNA recombinase
METQPINNVYMYNRVSTQNQAETGLPKQYEECKECLQKFKINNFEEYVDIGSSYRKSNALYNLNRLLRKVVKNDLIIVASISRLGRNVPQVMSALEKVRRKGALIYAVYESLFWNKHKYENTKFQNIVIKAREKADTLSMKARDVYNHITSNGGYYGKPSYGFSIDRNEHNIPILVPNNDEIKIINFIKDQYENKKSTFYRIANTLNERGTDKKGYVWTVQNVKRVYQYNVIDMDSSMNSFYQPDKGMLTRSGSGTLLHRTNSNSSFTANKKQCIPDSPPQTYKSKFKPSNLSKYSNNSKNRNKGSGSEEEEEYVQNKMKKLDITSKKGYGCLMS